MPHGVANERHTKPSMNARYWRVPSVPGPNGNARSGSMAVDRDRLKWAESGPTVVAYGTLPIDVKRTYGLRQSTLQLSGNPPISSDKLLVN
jgi:hypothetical protein